MWTKRRQKQMREDFIGRLQDRIPHLELASERLRTIETTLDNRSSVVVVASGIVLAANFDQSSIWSAPLAVFAVVMAVFAMLLAVMSLSVGSRESRRSIEAHRFLDLDAINALAAQYESLQEQIVKASRSIAIRRNALAYSYVLFAAAAIMLALNNTLGYLEIAKLSFPTP